MDLSQVSRTAILLLICRAVETERNKPAFNDPMAVLCLDRLMSAASDEDKRWMIRQKRKYEGVHGRDARAGVRRVQAFDAAANRFITGNPGCTVINLACGFDTRFWRIENEQCRYIEIDLPDVIKLKQELLQDHLGYAISRILLVLFSLGLYAQYQQRGIEFIPEFESLLASTGEVMPTELAARFGINLREPLFWQSSLDLIEKRIRRFQQLCSMPKEQ